MAGGAKAVESGDDLVKQVRKLGEKLGLEVREQYKVARRVWGAERKIDVILKNLVNGKTLGVECKFQGGGGSAEEKVPTTIQDISAWPIDGIVVFAGDGFTENMKSFLISTGKAVEFDDLEPWLRLYFALPLD
jgi:PD-(D/E)XK nuclease superfamily domain